MIITRTPFRISLFGGGTDYPKWYQQHGGVVLATTIDRYCYISCRYLPPFFEHRYRIVYSKIENVREISEIEHPAVRAVLTSLECTRGMEIHHDGDLPARSGLGSSSSFTVGLLNALFALEGEYVSKEQLASMAINIEQNVINEAVGSQDQISAAFGGFNRIEFHRDGSFDVSPMIVPKSRQDELEQNLMLFFTGFSRYASEVAQSKIDNMDKREKELHRIRAMVDEAIRILQSKNGSLDELGELLHESWQYKRALSSKVSNPAIDEIYESSLSAGASGGKLLGAGGGGFLVLYVKPHLQQRIRERLNRLVHVPFHFENSGSRVIVYQPNGIT